MEDIHIIFTEYKWGKNGFEFILEEKRTDFDGKQEGSDKSIEFITNRVVDFLGLKKPNS